MEYTVPRIAMDLGDPWDRGPRTRTTGLVQCSPFSEGADSTLPESTQACGPQKDVGFARPRGPSRRLEGAGLRGEPRGCHRLREEPRRVRRPRWACGGGASGDDSNGDLDLEKLLQRRRSTVGPAIAGWATGGVAPAAVALTARDHKPEDSDEGGSSDSDRGVSVPSDVVVRRRVCVRVTVQLPAWKRGSSGLGRTGGGGGRGGARALRRSRTLLFDPGAESDSDNEGGRGAASSSTEGNSLDEAHQPRTRMNRKPPSDLLQRRPFFVSDLRVTIAPRTTKQMVKKKTGKLNRLASAPAHLG
uniref:Uncharacterized protein n=1 Tax=Pyrodinium bahamense TaxID=73915 RepID=A0A7S0A716_9DINO|mmetsp:Transcript_25047/g.68834  ORF Transcript_25047/g.68834 Transcript_25047/m.68834 type:complete len:302 (+) Transcript_25047:107-1012(+)